MREGFDMVNIPCSLSFPRLYVGPDIKEARQVVEHVLKVGDIWTCDESVVGVEEQR